MFDWNNNEISILLSYHKLLEKSSANYLSVGIGFGITQRSINYDNIYFEDQFDGITNYSGTSSELLPANIYSKPEIKFGLQHNTALNSKLRIQSGVALHYLFKPNLSLYNNFEDKDYTGSKTILANHKITGILNLIYNVNSYTDIYPRLLITNQGQHFMINTGLSFRRSFYTLNQTAFHSGVSTRLVKNLNSIVPADLGLQVGFEIKNFIIGLHYDFGIKDAIQYKSPTHSMEISFTLISNYDYEGYICPSF
ncbi:MAG: type IX secretion system membrane protein PorP/SprF [Saprospiraceae bacterium]|nr:type IX secretion system membrane protein PorP/SprF [Saprospiraceae bacterium]